MARRQLTKPHVIIGDFNTGNNVLDRQGAPFSCSKYLNALEEMGWLDAWRRLHPAERNYTWFSGKGNGFRLDHAYLSPSLAGRLQQAFHSHSERRSKISDHATLIVDVNL